MSFIRPYWNVMKPSYYNHIYYRNDNSYWYNALTRKYFRVNASIGTKLEQLLDNPEQINKILPSLFKKLVTDGFIIDDNIDELQIIRNYNDIVISSKDYLLVIMPTFDCNFCCWYCVQQHEQSKMNLSTINAIKRHIKYMIEKENITSLNLSWFGGEPFMYFCDVIEPLTIYAKDLCEQNNITFCATATTNGALIDNTIANKLDNLNFTSFQITLDGNKENHDKVKYSNAIKSAFETTLRNINNILNVSTKAKILLRINYTIETLSLSIIEDVCKYIEFKNRSRVKVFLKKVWQAERHLENFELQSKIINSFEKYGFDVVIADLNFDFISCYTNRKYYLAISHSGGVYKCTNIPDFINKPAPGKICNDGSISWDSDYIKKYRTKSFENNICLRCKYLPICMGICPKNFNSLKHTCLNELIDFKISDSIINLIEHSYIDAVK